MINGFVKGKMDETVLKDIFSFIKEFGVAFDISSNWFQGWRWLKEITSKYKPDIKLNYR